MQRLGKIKILAEPPYTRAEAESKVSSSWAESKDIGLYS